MADTLEGPVPGGMARVLAARLESALSHEDRGVLEGFAGQVDALLAGYLRQAPEDLAALLRGEAAEGTPLAKAFLAGQLVLASAVAAQALAMRPEDDFFALIREEGPRAILGALASTLRADEIADMTGRGMVDTTRDLERMRAAGLIGRAQEDGEWLYVRTPNAMALLANEAIAGRTSS